MNHIIIGFRRMFVAAYGTQSLPFGAIVSGFIDEIIIPKIGHKISITDDGDDKAKLETLVELWKKFSKDGTPENNYWNAMANKSALGMISTYRMSKSQMEELMQDIAGKFYTHNSLRAPFERFDPMAGPFALVRMWTSIITLALRNNYREMYRHGFGTESEEIEDMDTDQEHDNMKNLSKSYKTDEDEEKYNELVDEMAKTVKQKLGHDEVAQAMFGRFWDVIQDKDPDAVNLKREVFAPVLEELSSRGVEQPADSTMQWKWKLVQREMLRFYEDKLHRKMTDRAKRHLHLASVVERIAHDEIGYMIAKYVLGGLNIPR